MHLWFTKEKGNDCCIHCASIYPLTIVAAGQSFPWGYRKLGLTKLFKLEEFLIELADAVHAQQFRKYKMENFIPEKKNDWEAGDFYWSDDYAALWSIISNYPELFKILNMGTC